MHFKCTLKTKRNPGKISGFDQNQRFFLSWATVWRTIVLENPATKSFLVDALFQNPKENHS